MLHPQCYYFWSSFFNQNIKLMIKMNWFKYIFMGKREQKMKNKKGIFILFYCPFSYSQGHVFSIHPSIFYAPYPVGGRGNSANPCAAVQPHVFSFFFFYFSKIIGKQLISWSDFNLAIKHTALASLVVQTIKLSIWTGKGYSSLVAQGTELICIYYDKQNILNVTKVKLNE